MEKSPINRSPGVGEGNGTDNNKDNESFEKQAEISISFEVEIKHDVMQRFSITKEKGETFKDLAKKIKDSVMHVVDKYYPEKHDKFEKLIGMQFGSKIHGPENISEDTENKLRKVLGENGITHYGMGGM